MNASKTALAAAAFGIVAMIAPGEAGEVKYNFTSEFSNQSVGADGRKGGRRDGLVRRGTASSGPGTAQASRTGRGLFDPIVIKTDKDADARRARELAEREAAIRARIDAALSAAREREAALRARLDAAINRVRNGGN